MTTRANLLSPITGKLVYHVISPEVDILVLCVAQTGIDARLDAVEGKKYI